MSIVTPGGRGGGVNPVALLTAMAPNAQIRSLPAKRWLRETFALAKDWGLLHDKHDKHDKHACHECRACHAHGARFCRGFQIVRA
jgi:hypothetical protein